jgi:hypothetical protein
MVGVFLFLGAYPIRIDSIISPGNYHRVNTPMTVIVRLRNISTGTVTNFPAICSVVGTGGALRYTNTQYIASLAPNDTVRVYFAPWTPTIVEMCTVIVRVDTIRRIRVVQIHPYLLIEGFNSGLPPDWQAVIVQGSYNWAFFTAGTYPTCTPYEGNVMAGYPSSMASAGSQARLISPPIVLGSTITSCTLKFYMVHDPGYSGTTDSLKIETSTNCTTFTRVTAFNRYAPSQAWVEHTVFLGNLSGTIYIGFLAHSGFGHNVFMDYVRLVGVPHSPSYIDIGIDTIISPSATHPINIPMTVIARLRRYSGGGPTTDFPAICSIVGANGALRYTNTQMVVWQEPLDTVRVTFSSWTPTVAELCTVKLRIIYPDSNTLNNRKTRTTLIFTAMLYEGFNGTTFPPLGWQAVIINGTYNWERTTSGMYPTCIPYEGEGMAQYRSWYASSGSCARLISPPILVSITTQCWLKFWMVHDPGYSTAPDSIRIETSTNGTTFTQVASIRRYASTQAWVEHLVYLGEFTGNFYFAFNALSGYGNNMFIDWVRLVPPPNGDVGVDSIIYPQAAHQLNTTMVPVARVKNYGVNTQTNFSVVCSIVGADGTLRYTNTQYVSSLNPAETTRVNFSAWTPTVAELCTVKMRTNLAGDENPLNDRKVRTTLIQPYSLIEGFNDPTFPPPGWQSVIIQGTYNWYRATGDTSGLYPYEGTGMARYPSWYAVAGSQARLITPLIAPTSPWRCTLKFYMHHDQSYPGPTNGPDSIKIETSTDGINFTRITAFRRYEPTWGWQEHSVYLGAFSVPFYVGFLGFSEYGNNMQIDYVRLSAFSGIAEDKINNIPLITLLNSSRPNPITNGFARISFTLAEPSQVALKIYDASGRLVKTLVNEFKNAGVYCVSWNCRDDYNRKVAEGVYFCTLQTGNYNSTKKLVLTK